MHTLEDLVVRPLPNPACSARMISPKEVSGRSPFGLRRISNPRARLIPLFFLPRPRQGVAGRVGIHYRGTRPGFRLQRSQRGLRDVQPRLQRQVHTVAVALNVLPSIWCEPYSLCPSLDHASRSARPKRPSLCSLL